MTAFRDFYFNVCTLDYGRMERAAAALAEGRAVLAAQHGHARQEAVASSTGCAHPMWASCASSC